MHSEKALSKITLWNKDFLKYLYFECTVEFTTAAATKQVTIRCQHLKNVKTRLTIYMTMSTTTTKPEPRRISCFTFWAAQKTTYHYFGSGHQLAQPLHTLWIVTWNIVPKKWKFGGSYCALSCFKGTIAHYCQNHVKFTEKD